MSANQRISYTINPILHSWLRFGGSNSLDHLASEPSHQLLLYISVQCIHSEPIFAVMFFSHNATCKLECSSSVLSFLLFFFCQKISVYCQNYGQSIGRMLRRGQDWLISLLQSSEINTRSETDVLCQYHNFIIEELFLCKNRSMAQFGVHMHMKANDGWKVRAEIFQVRWELPQA